MKGASIGVTNTKGATMPTHGGIAASVRRDKEEHPWRYCADARCLYRTGEKYCPNHNTTSKRREREVD